MDGLPIKYDVEGLLDLDLWLDNLDFTCARWMIGCNYRCLSNNDIKLMTECPFTVGKFEIYTNNMIVLDDGGWQWLWHPRTLGNWMWWDRGDVDWHSGPFTFSWEETTLVSQCDNAHSMSGFQKDPRGGYYNNKIGINRYLFIIVINNIKI